MREKLLYLTHRIPYPPNKGDKIRSYHWLTGLAKVYDIYLGTFVDDENDWQYTEKVAEHCASVHIEKLSPIKGKLKSLKGLLTGEPLTLPYYKNNDMQRWVNHTIAKENIKRVLVFSSSMAQYVEDDTLSSLKRFIDFVDVDSDKWLQYAEKQKWPMSWVYRREAMTLREYEKKVAESFSKSLFVSDKEASVFQEKIGHASADVAFVNNGVDTTVFDPALDYANPYNEKNRILVFTGAMDYWANVDAVTGFVYSHFKDIQSKMSDVQLYIVGSHPSKDVLALEKIKGVFVVGKVPAMQPYIRYADLVIAPMCIARGIQNKVLEGMAMEKTTLVSPQAYEGICAKPGEELLLVKNPEEWTDTVIDALNHQSSEIGKNARRFVIKHYSWSSNIKKLTEIIDH